MPETRIYNSKRIHTPHHSLLSQSGANQTTHAKNKVPTCCLFENKFDFFSSIFICTRVTTYRFNQFSVISSVSGECLFIATERTDCTKKLLVLFIIIFF